MGKKKISIILGVVLAVVVVVGLILMLNGQTKEWRALDSIPAYEQLANASVTEITIHKTVDSANHVVFEDEDLIKQWTEFLDSIEVRPVKGAADYFSQADGGRPVVSFKTDKAEIGIVFVTYEGKPVLEIDGKYYEYHTELLLPLEETYDIAKERHGEESHFYK